MMGKYRQRISSGIVMPLQQFIKREKSAGIVLGLSIVAAMALANSPWSEAYFHLFEHEFGFVVDGEPYLNYSLHHWINDGLMSMFFFVVGLELKREFIGGELADPRHRGGDARARSHLFRVQSRDVCRRRMGNPDGYRYCLFARHSLRIGR